MPAAVALLAACVSPAPAPNRSRRVAVTIDDLPAVSVAGGTDAGGAAMTEKLLSALRRAGAPAIGFVNEGKSFEGGSRVPARIALLSRWRAEGFELGNHTYSHLDLHGHSLAEMEADVLRGERELRPLVGRSGGKLRYFRHPYLHTGRDMATRQGFEAFLARLGYRVAPVTVDDSDWIFAKAYRLALERGDAALAARTRQAYVPYMEKKFRYWEAQSRSLFGREIAQVLLIHASTLNADCFGDLAAMLRRRGYAFVTLDAALSDPAYESPDTYTGPGGISWLHRWALTRGPGNVVPGEPRCPSFVMRVAGVEAE